MELKAIDANHKVLEIIERDFKGLYSGTGKPYGFARWQVEKRAPGLCFKCPLKKSCPIENFPDEITPHQLEKDPLLDFDKDFASTAGPELAVKNADPEFVLLTIDSLGDADPALAAHPDLPGYRGLNPHGAIMKDSYLFEPSALRLTQNDWQGLDQTIIFPPKAGGAASGKV